MLPKQEYEAPSEPLLLLNQSEMLLKQSCRCFVLRIMLRKRVYLEHNHGGQTENTVTLEHPQEVERLR